MLKHIAKLNKFSLTINGKKREKKTCCTYLPIVFQVSKQILNEGNYVLYSLPVANGSFQGYHNNGTQMPSISNICVYVLVAMVIHNNTS